MDYGEVSPAGSKAQNQRECEYHGQKVWKSC